MVNFMLMCIISFKILFKKVSLFDKYKIMYYIMFMIIYLIVNLVGLISKFYFIFLMKKISIRNVLYK